MHARVATFETSDTEATRQGLAELGRRAADGPPPGVPAVGLLILHQPDEHRVLSITLYETAEDLEQGDRALDAIDPPNPGGNSQRVSVDRYEVAVKIDR